MALEIITLAPMEEGDTWPGIVLAGPFTFELDGVPEPDPPGDLTRVQIQWYKSGDYRMKLDCDSDYFGESELTDIQHPVNIVTPDTWEFEVPALAYDKCPFTEGTWLAKVCGYYVVTGVPGVTCKLSLFILKQIVNPRMPQDDA